MSDPTKICGRCVYALFAPLYCCLAPLRVGDPNRNKGIERTTECFTGKYTENTRTKLKRQMQINQAKEALTKKENSDE